MSRTLPWYAWYANDFAGAVRGWSILERGGLREALDAQWTLDGLPADPEELRRVINATPREWLRIWPRIEAKLPIAADGKRRNPRLEQERKRGSRVSELRSQIGKLGAEKRWRQNGHNHAS